METNKKGIAIFDFDGTIIRKDSFIEFIRFTHGSARLYHCYFYHSFYIIFYLLKLYPNYKLKELFFGFFYKGMEEEKLKNWGIQFSEKKIELFYHSNTKEILQWHKDNSHTVLILTASSAIWIGEWCRRNGYDLIDTEFEVINGVYTGKIKGKNCYGKEKAKRIANLITAYNFRQTYGYGDSKGDLYFLNMLHYTHYGSIDHKIKYKINNSADT